METIEKERMDHQIELTEVKNQLYKIKENLHAMETIMQRQLKDLNGQLYKAKEEIAVKVAQVEQYQKQVEAYEQQVLRVYIYICACVLAYRLQYVPLDQALNT